MSEKKSFLLYGSTGWIGKQLVVLLQDANEVVYIGSSRLEDRTSILEELERYKPSIVLNAAGITGKPTVDWCETNQLETIRTNVIGTLNLADCCHLKNIYCLFFGTGCIYTYDADHVPFSGPAFKENEAANFSGSLYSKTRGLTQQLLALYPNLCLLRLRLPISDDFSCRNLIFKLLKYKYVTTLPNSMTVLPQMLPIAIEMAKRGITGEFNFTNPGAITHPEILEMYKRLIDPTYQYQCMSIERQNQLPRSHNQLDCTKLQQALPDIVLIDVHVAIQQVLERMKTRTNK